MEVPHNASDDLKILADELEDNGDARCELLREIAASLKTLPIEHKTFEYQFDFSTSVDVLVADNHNHGAARYLTQVMRRNLESSALAFVNHLSTEVLDDVSPTESIPYNRRRRGLDFRFEGEFHMATEVETAIGFDGHYPVYNLPANIRYSAQRLMDPQPPSIRWRP